MQQLSDQIQNEDARACVVCGHKLPPTLPRISRQAQTFLQPAIPFNGHGRLRAWAAEKPVFSLLLSLGATRDSANEGGSPQKPTE